MPNVLTSGTAQKAAGDEIRLPMDFGDISQLIDGASVSNGALVMTVNIDTYTITCPSLISAGGTIRLEQLDYPYQPSAKFAGGTAGTTYDVVFTVVLDDADRTTIARTAPLKVL